jgi:hypothetical protein
MWSIFKKPPVAQPKDEFIQPVPLDRSWIEPVEQPISYPLYAGLMHNAKEAMDREAVLWVSPTRVWDGRAGHFEVGNRQFYDASDGSVWELVAGSWVRLTGPNQLPLSECRWLEVSDPEVIDQRGD